MVHEYGYREFLLRCFLLFLLKKQTVPAVGALFCAWTAAVSVRKCLSRSLRCIPFWDSSNMSCMPKWRWGDVDVVDVFFNTVSGLPRIADDLAGFLPYRFLPPSAWANLFADGHNSNSETVAAPNTDPPSSVLIPAQASTFRSLPRLPVCRPSRTCRVQGALAKP